MLRFGVHCSWGLKLLHSVCSILGFWIPNRALSGKKALAVRFFGAVLTSAFVGQSLFSLYASLCFTVDSYVTGVIYAVNVITVLKHLFCVLYFQIYKKELADIYSELQVDKNITGDISN